PPPRHPDCVPDTSRCQKAGWGLDPPRHQRGYSGPADSLLRHQRRDFGQCTNPCRRAGEDRVPPTTPSENSDAVGRPWCPQYPGSVADTIRRRTVQIRCRLARHRSGPPRVGPEATTITALRLPQLERRELGPTTRRDPRHELRKPPKESQMRHVTPLPSRVHIFMPNIGHPPFHLCRDCRAPRDSLVLPVAETEAIHRCQLVLQLFTLLCIVPAPTTRQGVSAGKKMMTREA